MRRTFLLLAAAVAVLALTADASLGATARSTSSPPLNASPPTVSGTDRVGQTLSASTGSWGGVTPMTYSLRWQRCDPGGSSCSSIAGATSQTYVVATNDLGMTIRINVTATNADGSSQALSDPSGAIAPLGSAPANTGQPNPSGTAQDGQTLTVDNGTWSGTEPITFSSQWQQCTAVNPVCTDIPGATASSYLVATADVGSTLRAIITATNSSGASSASSNLTTAVVAAAPAGSIVIPVTQVSAPDRLVVSSLTFSPSPGTHAPITARFEVTDSNGHPVSGALVYVIGLPYGWTRNAAEQATDATGWATITIVPTSAMPRTAALVMFVRARKPGDNLLAGVSTRRLVQIRIRG